MNKRNLNKTELDAIGERLIERSSVGSKDIENIISNPDLFRRINVRIVAAARPTVSKSTTGVSSLSLFRRHIAAFAGVAVILAAAVAAAILLRPAKHLIAANVAQVPAAMPDAARPDLAPQVVGRNQSPGRAQDRDPHFEKAMVRLPVRTESRKPRVPDSVEPEADFYAISYTGDPTDTSGGRIIRVDMQRSSLLALGVNVPLENETEVVKADLLVGTDGVARAIRVVK